MFITGELSIKQFISVTDLGYTGNRFLHLVHFLGARPSTMSQTFLIFQKYLCRIYIISMPTVNRELFYSL